MSDRMPTRLEYVSMAIANHISGETLAKLFNESGKARFTVCPSCAVDDFTHVGGCEIGNEVDELLEDGDIPDPPSKRKVAPAKAKVQNQKVGDARIQYDEEDTGYCVACGTKMKESNDYLSCNSQKCRNFGMLMCASFDRMPMTEDLLAPDNLTF